MVINIYFLDTNCFCMFDGSIQNPPIKINKHIIPSSHIPNDYSDSLFM